MKINMAKRAIELTTTEAKEVLILLCSRFSVTLLAGETEGFGRMSGDVDEARHGKAFKGLLERYFG